MNRILSWETRLLASCGVTALLIILAVVSFAQRPHRRDGPGLTRGRGGAKPEIEDTKRLNVYADNWFSLYINGELVAVDSIRFIPHNVVAIDVLPEYPMTIAVMAKDNADAQTGMEYRNTQIGDGGLILKLADGTVTGEHWKAKVVSHGPINGETRDPRVIHHELPDNWFAVDFDDSSWEPATEHSARSVDPKRPFYEHDFSGAKFIWGDDLKLDNTVLFRLRVDSPPDGSKPKSFPILHGN